MAVQWNFGETILSVLQKERDRKQEQEKLAQTMAYENRQLDLMNVYRNKQIGLGEAELGETKRYHDWQMNKPLDPLVPKTEGSFKNPDTKTFWRWDETFQRGVDTKIPYDEKEGRTTIINKNETTPQPTEAIDWQELDNLDKNYYDRDPNGKVTIGSGVNKYYADKDVWRQKYSEVLNPILKKIGISEESLDELWTKAGVKEDDDIETKREKIKNVITYLKDTGQITPLQAKGYYKYGEYKTR